MRRSEVQRRTATAHFLPGISLPLIEIAPLHGGDELLRLAEVVAVVGIIVTAERDAGSMVEIVGPQAVEAKASLLQRPDQLRMLPLVLRNDDDLSFLGGCARLFAEEGHNVLWRGI